MTKRIAILGSTGSIGVQTLDVLRSYPEQFSAEVLSAQNSCDLLIRQAIEFLPNAVVIGNERCYEKVAEGLKDYPIKVFAGQDSIAQIVQMEDVDLVLNALVGYSGLRPTLSAIEAGKNIALANKETLVVAGQLIIEKAIEKRIMLLPVDSEHSAIFQCLAGERANPIDRIFLTASGGPFRGFTIDQLTQVTKHQALIHPRWKMGNKITIDSATLMNKGLEVIEAKWLFDLEPHQIEVVVHPQSIVHSLVEFSDGSIKAQLGLPDMKLPILYALTYPSRFKTEFPRFNFIDYPTLTFEKPDLDRFECLMLAYEAMRTGGNMPCILNGANEIAVAAFLEDRIGFLDIPRVIEKCMESSTFAANPRLEDLVSSNLEARAKATAFINTHTS